MASSLLEHYDQITTPYPDLSAYFPDPGGDTFDSSIIGSAELANSTLSYTTGLLTGIVYEDTSTVTNNSKVLSYDVSDFLETVTHTFDYSSQTWTVTKTMGYTGSDLTSTVVSIVKA